MSFKRDIIIVNQFSVNRNGAGTKGNTPGKFVLRYMARDGATETITPVIKQPIDNFITRYMARGKATETVSNLKSLHNKFKGAQGLGGRSFGKAGKTDPGSVSLSDGGIRSLSKTLQRAFDHGKTVLETVISFDGNYLKRNNLADKDVELDSRGHARYRGAFRGRIDQLKLRKAIMNGLGRMAARKVNGRSRFSSLAYVGVIQVDTQQVHCHLAMADLGSGQTLNTRGRVEQRGVLSDKDKTALRRGINQAVLDYEPVRQLTKQEEIEQQDTRTFVKKYTQRAMAESSFAQIIFAVLPRDKRLWRAESRARVMRRPNAIMRFYVGQVLKKPHSGYSSVRKKADRYAYERQQREDLSPKDYRKLVEQGHRRIMDSCVNAVYGLLRQVPESAKSRHTRILDGLSASLDMLALHAKAQPPDPAYEFSYHLRSYGSRMKGHREKADEYQGRMTEYEERQESGQTKNVSHIAYDFYKTEHEYQNKAMAKYQLLLPLLGKTGRWRKRLEQLRRQRRYLRQLQKARGDENMRLLRGKALESYAKQHYDMSPRDAELLNNRPSAFDNAVRREQESYKHGIDDLTQKLGDDNLTLKFDKSGYPAMSRKTPYNFDDVKAVDLQDTQDDFPDSYVSRRNIQSFLDTADRRVKAWDNFSTYAVRTHQPDLMDLDTQADVARMAQQAKKYRRILQHPEEMQMNKQGARELTNIPEKRTVPLNTDLTSDIEKQIKGALRQVDKNFTDQENR